MRTGVFKSSQWFGVSRAEGHAGGEGTRASSQRAVCQPEQWACVRAMEAEE